MVKFSPRYKLVFSLLNQDSSLGGALLQWNIQSLLERECNPLRPLPVVTPVSC